MDRIFDKIYQEVICSEEDMYGFGLKMEREVSKMLARYRDKMDQADEGELERMTEQIDHIVSSAKKGGFYFGVRFAVRGLLLLLADGKGADEYADFFRDVM